MFLICPSERRVDGTPIKVSSELTLALFCGRFSTRNALSSSTDPNLSASCRSGKFYSACRIGPPFLASPLLQKIQPRASLWVCWKDSAAAAHEQERADRTKLGPLFPHPPVNRRPCGFITNECRIRLSPSALAHIRIHHRWILGVGHVF
jgi:hypothetical protein